MRTYTGREVNILELKPSDICIEDIAHSLSQLCRFTGHTKQHYSVAQHCLLVSRRLPELALEGLMHEGEEPYTNDLHTFLKYQVGMETYREIGRGIHHAVWSRFGLVETPEIHAAIKRVDTEVCDLEKQSLFVGSPWPKEIVPMTMQEAESEFLRRFTMLYRERHP